MGDTLDLSSHSLGNTSREGPVVHSAEGETAHCMPDGWSNSGEIHILKRVRCCPTSDDMETEIALLPPANRSLSLP